MKLKNKKHYIAIIPLLTFLTFLTIDFIGTHTFNQSFIKEYSKLNTEECNIKYTITGDTIIIPELKIQKNTSDCIIKTLKSNNIKKINLVQSEGGLSTEGATIGHYIKNNNISVFVEKACLSACTYILFSSKTPSISEYALIGIHRIRIDSKFWKFLNKLSFNLIEKNLNKRADNTRRTLFSNEFNFYYYNQKINTNENNNIILLTKDEIMNQFSIKNIIS